MDVAICVVHPMADDARRTCKAVALSRGHLRKGDLGMATIV
ncbi:hypothetical protein ACQPYH_06085 [Kribbella sp. CA-245084]